MCSCSKILLTLCALGLEASRGTLFFSLRAAAGLMSLQAIPWSVYW